MEKRLPGKTLLTIIILLLPIVSFSQELKVSDYKSAPLDISARENVVYDPNGDACAIIKARTGIPDMKFTSDLEIKKVEFRDGEYWLWVPPGTHLIAMEAPDFPKIEFTLPEYTEEFNVYIIFLTAVLPEKTVYKPANTVSFDSKPRNSEVFINDIFYGSTPITMNIPNEVFEYRVQSKTFITETATDTIMGKTREYYFKLRKDPKATRFYSIITGGVVLKENKMLWGFNIGTLGKIGSSFSVYLHKPGPGEAPVIYPDTTGMVVIPSVSARRERFVFGINPRITNKIFISTGIGFAYSSSRYSNILNAGLIIRTNNRILFNLNTNLLFSQSHFDDSGNYSKNHLVYDATDINFGVGYNF